MHIFFSPQLAVLGLLDSIALNGNAHGSNNNCGENAGSGVRHRATSAGEEISEDAATDGAKSYTAEQLDAVKQCVSLELQLYTSTMALKAVLNIMRLIVTLCW